MSNRMDKVNKLLKQELSKLIYEEYAEEYGVISITYLNTSPDLKTAEVGISIFDKNKEEEIIKNLIKNSEELRYKIGNLVELKDMPKFNFILDTELDNIAKIDHLLDKIEKENKK